MTAPHPAPRPLVRRRPRLPSPRDSLPSTRDGRPRPRPPARHDPVAGAAVSAEPSPAASAAQPEEPSYETSFHPPVDRRAGAVLGVALGVATSAGIAVSVILGGPALGPAGLFGPRGGEYWAGLACSAVPLLIVGVTTWSARMQSARVWLRATPRQIEWERVWWSLRRYDVLPVRPGDGVLDRHGPWFGREGPEPVLVRLDGQSVTLTPPLTGERAAEVRAGLGAVLGSTPPGRSFGPWLTPADPAAPSHPAVTVGRDRRGRATVTTPLRPIRGRRDRLPLAATGLCLALFTPILWAIAEPPDAADRIAFLTAMSVCTLCGLIAGAALAAAPWATVRVTVGARRVSVRAGWGRLRSGPSVRQDSVRAAVVASHHEGVWHAINGDQSPASWLPNGTITRNPVAALVRPRRRFQSERAFLPLTGRYDGDRIPFAAAAAGAVAAALLDRGWEPAVPTDWRFRVGAPAAGSAADPPAAPTIAA